MDRPWIEAGLKCAVVRGDDVPALLVQRVARLRAREGLDQYFLGYLIAHKSFMSHVLSVQTGTAVPHISGEQIQAFVFDLPSRPEQRLIAEVLGALDDEIESNGRLVLLAEQLAIARLTPLDARLPIGMIAEMDRRSVEVCEFAGVDVEHFSLPAFDAGRVPDRCPGSSIKSNKLAISSPSVLISKLNPHIPRVWHAVPSSDALALSSTEFIVLRSKSNICTQELWAVAATEDFSKALSKRVTGTTGSHQRVRPEDVLNVSVADPRQAPQPLRAAVRLLVDRATAAREESQRLARLRDALLPALMSGELRVREAEALVSDRTAE